MPTISLLDPAQDLQGMGPGIYRMSNEDYHRSAGVSRSGLAHLLRSPQHYQAYKATPVEPTPAMILGTAFHVKVLEPDQFEQQVAVAPKVDRRTNAGKEAWGSFLNANIGKTVITTEDYEAIAPMAEAVHAHPIASALLTDGDSELSYYATLNGVLCKSRPDYYKPGFRWGLADLKSCLDARPEPFARACWTHGYYLQSAYYLDIVSEARGEHIDHFLFVAVEKEPPYAVAVYLADREMVEMGRIQYRRALATYAECARFNNWPGYPMEITPISLPMWATKEMFDE
jgi:hypothetical protein